MKKGRFKASLFLYNCCHSWQYSKKLKNTENKRKKRLANMFASRSLPLQPDAP